MRVHFTAVTEPTPKYLNMLKALLYSFRKNAGIYKNAPFTIVTNGTNLPEQELLNIQKQFSPIDVHVMPRLGSTPFANKFHALYGVDESTYDVLVYVDCDVVILEALDGITAGLDPDKPYIKAKGIGKESSTRILGYDRLIKGYGNLTENELQTYRQKEFNIAYPLFNAGVYILTKKAVLAIRDDAIKICHELHEKKVAKSFKDFIRFRYYKFLTEKFLREKKESKQPQWVRKAARHSLPKNVIYYPNGQTEQMGLALAVIKHRIPFEMLDKKFNWTSQNLMPNGTLPAVLHYMSGIYNDIEREHLFEGNWIEEYLNSDYPTKKALANIINSYNFESQS